ncbi:MAG: PAS domain-containing protein [Zavarzinia sp.]|nr:PAS domain-containing protein [Zavarzinia sp.]
MGTPPPLPPEAEKIDRRRQEMAAALSAVVRHVRDGIVIIDEADHIASINPHLAGRAALDVAALIGRPASDLLGWSELEATTTEPLPARIDLITESGRLPCEARILPILRNERDILRIVILHLPEAGAASGLGDFERRVLAALGRNLDKTPPEGVSGQIEVIVVDAVKQRLGPRWRVVAERVMTTAATMISQRLDPGETYARIADTSFVVAFKTTSIEEAAGRARAIAADILHHLLGDAEAAGIAVLGSADPLPEAAPAETGSPPVPAGILEARIAAGRDQYQQRIAASIARLLREARLETRPILRRGGQDSGLVLSEPDVPTREGLAMLRQAGVFPRTHPETGLLPFALTIDRLYRMIDGPGAQIPVHVVPVPLILLDDRQGLEQFLALARPLPEALRRCLILMISDIGRESARPRLTDLARRIAPFCRRVGLAIDGLEDGAIAYDDIRPTGLRIAWTPALATIVAREPERLRRLVEKAHRHHCLILAQGSMTPEERSFLEDQMTIDLTVD